MKFFPALTYTFLACAWMTIAGCSIEIPEEPAYSGTEISFDPVASPPSGADANQPPVQAEFASIEEGLAVLVSSSAASDKKQQAAAYAWLSKQGSTAVGPVAAAMNDAELPMEVRRLACGVLGQLGPGASEHLLAASQSEEMALKLRAIETLPAIDPPQQAAIDRLIVLLDDPSEQVMHTAIRALGRIGPPAKAAADKLNALRKNHASVTTQQEAGKSLKLVRPIRTFDD
jgi:HEAT repeat protein